jgi:thiamine biosynthesis lipoprotein
MEKEMQKFTLAIISFLCISFFMSCTPSPIPQKTQTALNTVCTIQLFEYGTEKIYTKIFDRLDEIEKRLSVTISSSEIAHINKAAGDFPVKVSADTFFLIEASLSFAEQSRSAFNPAMGPLVSLWNITGFNPLEDSLPLPEQVSKALQKTDYSKIILNKDAETVFLQEEGMALDLGGIAKGWAADELVKILSDNKIPYAIINLGGNIYAYGSKDTGEAWNIGIKNPFDSNAPPVIRIETYSASIVTSGVYERFFMKDGIMYHHILDSVTGYSVQNGLVSVTIVDPSSMAADALSTLVFALGREKGLEYMNGKKIKGILITKDYEVYASDVLRDSIEILDSAFILIN